MNLVSTNDLSQQQKVVERVQKGRRTIKEAALVPSGVRVAVIWSVSGLVEVEGVGGIGVGVSRAGALAGWIPGCLIPAQLGVGSCSVLHGSEFALEGDVIGGHLVGFLDELSVVCEMHHGAGVPAGLPECLSADLPLEVAVAPFAVEVDSDAAGSVEAAVGALVGVGEGDGCVLVDGASVSSRSPARHVEHAGGVAVSAGGSGLVRGGHVGLGWLGAVGLESAVAVCVAIGRGTDAGPSLADETEEGKAPEDHGVGKLAGERCVWAEGGLSDESQRRRA